MPRSDSAPEPSRATATRALPPRPNLERLRNEAKHRLKALRDRDASAKLNEAQLLIAREYGFPSWRALKAYAEAILNPTPILAASDSFVSVANRKDIVHLRELLAQAAPGQHELDLALARALCGAGETGTLPLRLAIADLLIDAGANPNGQYGGDYGPIVFAVCEGVDADALEYLIDHGAEVSFPPVATKYGLQTPVSHAAWTYVRGRNEARHRCLDLLIAHGAVHRDDAALAIVRGDTGRLAAFLDTDPGLLSRRFPEFAGLGNLDLHGATLLHLAIEYGERECADLLLDRGADLNAPAEPRADGTGGQTPIFHAIRSWKGANFQLLRHLLARGGVDWAAQARLAMPNEAEPRLVTPSEYAAGDPRERRLLSRFGAPEAQPPPLPEIPAETVESFRAALMEGDIDAVHHLLHEHPALTASRPWAPRWDGTAVEGIAFRCVWHRPRMREIAALLVGHGTDADLPSLARCGLKEEVIRRLDDEPELLNQPDAAGRTPLYRAACVYGAFPEGEAVADELVRRGAEIDLFTACTLGLRERVAEIVRRDPQSASAPDPEGMTALHWACRNRRHPEASEEIARLLCEAGADVEAANPKEEGMRPLHHCGEWSSTPETAAMLLRFGAEINAATPDGWTPLDYAIDRGRHPMIAFLTAQGAERSPENDDVPRRFLLAVSHGDLPRLRQMAAERPELINLSAPHPMWGGTPQPLHVAIEQGSGEIFEWLLESGADIDGKAAAYDRWTPLLLALYHHRHGMAETLLGRGAAVGLPEAIMLPDDARVEQILKGNPARLHEPMPSLASPLRFARTVAGAKRLLALGAPLDQKDRYGNTPLSAIANNGKFPEIAPLLRLLLDHGAEAPPWVLAAAGDLERLRAAAEFEPEIAHDPRCAFAAIEAGSTAIVEWMLSQGLPASARSGKGGRETLLHAAAWHGNVVLAKKLLSLGADRSATDHYYRTTPAAWAQTAFDRLGRAGCKAVYELLQ